MRNHYEGEVTRSGASLHTIARATQAAIKVVQTEVIYDCPTSLLRGIVTMCAWSSPSSCSTGQTVVL